MKAITTLLTICLLGYFSACQGQTKTTTKKDTIETIQTDSTKQMNLIDEQVKMYGSIFDLAGAGDDNPIGGATNYLELIEKMKAPEELKRQLGEMYKVYDLSLDPKKKDSLKLMVDKMMRNAIDKTQNH